MRRIVRHALIAAASLLAASAAASAPSVSLHGTLGDKALLMIDGSLRTLSAGQSQADLKLLSVERDTARVVTAGGEFTLRVGEAPVRIGPARSAGGDRLMLTADHRGHFFTMGSVDGRAVQFMVDTGATTVAIGRREADRIGLDYRSGRPLRLKTANGTINGWELRISQLQVGDMVAHGVEAVVTESAMPIALLGNSFLSQFDMHREGTQLMLIRR